MTQPLCAGGSHRLVGRDPGDEDVRSGQVQHRRSLDITFSGDGKVTTDFTGSEDRARALVIQANGRIVAAGFARVSGTGADFAPARYTCLRRTSRPMSIPLCP
jgi:hypothetical protein